MVDNATDEDGKEFYTITTADESVFYLVIDSRKPARTSISSIPLPKKTFFRLLKQTKEPPKEVTRSPDPNPTEPVEEIPSRTLNRRKRTPPFLSAPDRCRGGAGRRWYWLLFQDLQPEA